MGALLWKRRVREDLRTFVPTKSIQIPLSSHFSERGLVIRKNGKSPGVSSGCSTTASRDRAGKGAIQSLGQCGRSCFPLRGYLFLAGQVASIRCHVGAHSDARGRKL